jgi:hypothetical protein
MMLYKLLLLIPLLIFSSCILTDESPIETSSDAANLIQSGDIIVTNLSNDSIILLDSDGNYKDVLVDSQTDSTLIYNGLNYDTANNQILFVHDSTIALLDSVKAISLYDGTVSTVISNSFLTGVMPGLTRLTGGELLVLETTATAEKFLADNSRVGGAGAAFMNATLTATVTDIASLSTGGFVACNTATAVTARTYTSAGVTVATATSALPVNAANATLGALGASSCIEDLTGQVIVAYSGATDAVRAYTSSLSAPVWTFADTNILTTPGKLAVKANGNILITDTAFNHIVELNSTGGLVRVIGGTVLAGPNNILVVP